MCTSAGIGCVADKQDLADGINSFYKEFRERRSKLEENPNAIKEILEAGAQRARKIAQVTIEEVYEKLCLAEEWGTYSLKVQLAAKINLKSPSNALKLLPK